MVANITYEYSGNKVTMYLDEGAYTTNSKYDAGGYWADDLLPGTPVKLSTAQGMTVTRASASDRVIGMVYGTPQIVTNGSQYGRTAAIQLFGDFVHEVEIATDSGTIAIGDSVYLKSHAGSFSKGVWAKDASPFASAQLFTLSGNGEVITVSAVTPNTTVALQSSSATGSIASGSTIYVLFGAHSF